MTHDVFISHSSEDWDIADAVRAALAARGFACGPAPGDDPDEAIGRSRAFVLILTARSAGSPHVLRQAQWARDRAAPFVVFRTENVLPSAALEPLLGGSDRFDALTPPVAPHLDYLADRVALLLGGGRQLTEPPSPFEPSARRSRSWLPIVAAGLAGLGAIALAAMVSGQ